MKEEYAVLNELDLEMEKQSLVSGCDMVTCRDKGGRRLTLYFDITKVEVGDDDFRS